MQNGLEALLAPLKGDPTQAAILLDVDGTLAPIVERPEDAAVPEAARELLGRLAERYALVACVSGRPALDARRVVGLDQLAYSGNHGYELLQPGDDEPHPDPSLDGHDRDAGEFVAGLDDGDLERAGIRIEDKGAIVALHWRGADNEGEAEALAHEIEADAEWGGLVPHRGRKVLEIRPNVAINKGIAVAALIPSKPVRAALYAGDDRTDADAFAALRMLRSDGDLDAIACIAVASEEAPKDVTDGADAVVDGPDGLVEALAALAEDERVAFVDLLRMTVLLAAAAATALAAVTLIAADRSDDTLLIVAGGWWAIAIAAGLILGQPGRAAEALAPALAGARTTPTLPADRPGRVAFARLWPLGVFALVAGGVGFAFPAVAAIGTGFALLAAMVMRTREAAVTAVEDRDGVRFYVEPGSSLEPVKLVRTPGLRRDRPPAGHPPPPGAAV